MPAWPPCPMASACLRAQVGSRGWQTRARLRMRWPSPVGKDAEQARLLLAKSLSLLVQAASLEQTLPVLPTRPHPVSKRCG